MGYRRIALLHMGFALALAACTPAGAPVDQGRPRIEAGAGSQRLVVASRPRGLTARTAEEAATARAVAERNPAAELSRADSARRVSAEGLAFLVGTPAGRRFLALPFPRALARGDPAAQCPATGVAGGPRAVETALGACLAALADRPDCGCEILAYDDVVAVDRGELAYATGTSARLRVPALGIDGLYVAEAEPDGTLLLRGLGGPFGRVERRPDGVAVILADGRRFDGTAEAVGFRRGRLAERIRAQDAQGRRLVLLTGFDPDELAERAAAFLAWAG